MDVVGAIVALETVLVIKVEGKGASNECTSLGASAARIIILGYPGELIVEGDLSQRWFTGDGLVPFLYIIYEVLVGLADARHLEGDPGPTSTRSDRRTRSSRACPFNDAYRCMHWVWSVQS